MVLFAFASGGYAIHLRGPAQPEAVGIRLGLGYLIVRGVVAAPSEDIYPSPATQ